jgi:hypothetical protein
MDNNMKSLIMNRGTIITMILAILLAINAAFAGEMKNNEDGRTLPDGRWQARNAHATQSSLPGNNQDPFNILTDWGEDIRISNFDLPNSQWPKIAASGNFINIVWWYLSGDSIFLARSTDGGAPGLIIGCLKMELLTLLCPKYVLQTAMFLWFIKP